MGSEKEMAKTIGMEIRALRRQKGLSVEELAYQSNMDAKHLASIERGDIENPGLFTMYRIVVGLKLRKMNSIVEEAERRHFPFSVDKEESN
ncbi:XRE family transcriptional regulator [Bacillus salacetis]|uniref:XRE family transcriptional regulator n=1 Tax=Bacillus salacetis TaxID=2315464 RepID=A0A3A1QXP7_9BACI|nr:helix-turn-helix transcriptional regulator [Bacillus salacetis]RIW30710.1 XRE family transcriptional regulator [Bacillus salacetis]